MKRRQYKTPPIEEALCEFRFSDDSDWDLTVIGKFQSQEDIRSEYLGKPVEHRMLEGNLRIVADLRDRHVNAVRLELGTIES